VVNAFWFMTLYSVLDYRVVDNSTKRYNLSSQSAYAGFQVRDAFDRLI
jgi:hypothetical protein